MKVVVYDEAMFEPITVLNLRGVSFADIEQRDGIWRIPLPPEYEFDGPVGAGHPKDTCTIKTIELRFERHWRESRKYGHQERWTCFTDATDLILLIEPSWLLGQERAVAALADQNERLTEMLLRVMR